jgi:hypothetical protein
MATVKHSDELASSLIAAAQSLLNNASGLRAEIKQAINRQHRTTIQELSLLGLQARLMHLRIGAFTEMHSEVMDDIGQQSLLDHLHHHRGAIGTAVPLLKSLIELSK